jgi:hypothetical protein
LSVTVVAAVVPQADAKLWEKVSLAHVKRACVHAACRRMRSDALLAAKRLRRWLAPGMQDADELSRAAARSGAARGRRAAEGACGVQCTVVRPLCVWLCACVLLTRCAHAPARCTLQRKTRELARNGDGEGGYRIAFGETFELYAAAQRRLPLACAACRPRTHTRT